MANGTSTDVILTGAWCNIIVAKHYGYHSIATEDIKNKTNSRHNLPWILAINPKCLLKWNVFLIAPLMLLLLPKVRFRMNQTIATIASYIPKFAQKITIRQYFKIHGTVISGIAKWQTTVTDMNWMNTSANMIILLQQWHLLLHFNHDWN